jgi:iron complex outermembrane receptor protein
MAVGRCLFLALVGGLLLAPQLSAQDGTGTIRGRVLDAASQQPLSSVNITVVGTTRGAITQTDGSYLLVNVPAGTRTVRASRIGYAPSVQTVTVATGGAASADFSLQVQTVTLGEVVSVGYGTQKREAITGSVATVDADKANVGVITNANQMIQGRVAGISITSNSGEPGGNAQIRIRGGTSISASNDPLYVVDGVPLQNDATTPDALGIGSINAGLNRSPINSLSPEDIESITILKDASATAIYGSRGANGVILITTKTGQKGSGSTEYDTYVAAATPAKSLDLASGQQYRTFVRQMVAAGQLPATAEAALGTANTDWEKAIERTGYSQNHSLAFSGGSEATQYRASLNYFDQQGVVISSGLKRYQGRLNARHDAINGKLRLALNLMASRVNNDFVPAENGGGFNGGLFTNMVIYNPTFPVKRADGTYYEIGSGAQDVRNPVGLANSYDDYAPENRVLGNVTGTVSLLSDLTTQTTVGVDYTDANRRVFAPRSSPVGAQYGGYASQANKALQNINFQQLLTYAPHFGDNSSVEAVGGYEYSDFDARGFGAQMQGFITDAFGVNNLGAGTQAQSPVPYSYHVESKLVSFFGRAVYDWADRFTLNAVLRYDGSSRLAPGHQWQSFPGLSASWRFDQDPFMAAHPIGLSRLALRAGWGRQGNQSVEPYQTQLLLRADAGAIYPFGGALTTGLRAAQVGNPDLKWETTAATNIGLDYGFSDNRISGSIDVYQKDTKDLLLDVAVPQPAVVSTRIENIGTLRNKGLEASVDAALVNEARRTLSSGLVLTVERGKITSLGGGRLGILTGDVFGQGQSGNHSQQIMVGQPLGTFFGPRFLRVVNGHQTFACKAGSAGCVNGVTSDPTEADKEILGHASPDFALGLHSNATWSHFDASWLWRGEFGRSVFNNTALVYETKGNAKQGRNFLASTLSQPDSISEPSKFSSRYVENGRFVRLQNATVGYTFDLPSRYGVHSTRIYLSGDNLLLFTPYRGYDPEVFVAAGLASRGTDYVTYPRPRTFTFGAHVQF